MGNLKFGGVSTESLDLVIQAPPTYTFPEKDVELQHIPGRNGDIVIDNNCYKNVTRIYSIASVFRSGTNFIENAERLIEWLHNNPGYQRLEDSYDPDVYRLATYKEGGSLVNYYDQATALNVTFECKPQRYLKSGENPVTHAGEYMTIVNPTSMNALPEIKLSDFTITNDYVLMMLINNSNRDVVSMVTINSFPSEYDDLIIDSDKQLVYTIKNNESINLANLVHLNGLSFPKLQKGSNIITLQKYEKQLNNIDTYSNIIDKYKEAVFALYKPYESLVESKQDTASIKSYTSLIESKQEIYPAEAYSSYCIDRAEHIKIESFNEIIQRNSMIINFNTSLFAKPTYAKLKVKEYDPGFYLKGIIGTISTKIHYSIGDIVYVSVWLSGQLFPSYYLYKCTHDYYAEGTNTDPDGWDYSWDTVLANGWWERYDNKTYSLTNLPSFQMYGWDVSPSEASIPLVETESGIKTEKQLLSIATEYTEKKETKYKNQYMFLYKNSFTTMQADSRGIVHVGAFIIIKDNTDDKLSSDSIKYVGAIDQTALEASYTPQPNGIAKDYYDGIKAGHNILDIFPNLANAIGQGHDCTITLYKAKWVYNSDDPSVDPEGHPELDLDYPNTDALYQKVIYNIPTNPVPDNIKVNAQEYDPSDSYAQGDYCIYLGLYYQCKTSNVTGPWDPSKWNLLPYSQGDSTQIKGVSYINRAEGYFYKEKNSGILSSLFSLSNKSGWTYINEAGNILEYVEWDSRKKEFQYQSTLNSTADYTIERYYLSQLPPYEDIILEDVYVEDENGNIVIDSAGNKVNATITARFNINIVDDTLTNISSIMPLYDGYFKILDSNGDPLTGFSIWQPCHPNTPISVTMKATKAYQFVFIDKAPNYSDEEGFPEWLDPYPVLFGASYVEASTDIEKLNASYYDFEVKESAYYRYSFYENNIAKKTEWAYILENHDIGFISPDADRRPVDEIVEINKIDGTADKFPVSQFQYVSYELNSADDDTYIIVESIEDLEYDSSETYNINDVAIHDNYYCKCLENGVTGSWDDSKWDVIGTAIEALEFDEETIYNDGDYCIYGRSVYRCLDDDTEGIWTDYNWEFIGNYIKDVGFYYLDDHGNQVEFIGNIPYPWIYISIEKGANSDFSDTVLKFYPAEDGLYKWDTNLEWIEKTASTEDTIVVANYKSDTYLYYLQDLPSYDGLDTDLYTFDISTASNGNPETVTIKVIANGLYKAGNNVDYVYLKAGSTLVKMTIYENPVLTYLNLIEDESLANAKITVTPRWWKL